MHKIDSPNATGAAEFTDGDPTQGIEATEVWSKWLNSLQRELIAVLVAAGLTPDDTDDDQVLEAILALLAGHANLTSPHSATSAATASRLIVRDASGRAKVAAPAATDDIARKAEVDSEAATRAAADSAEAATRAAADSAEATTRANADTAHAALTVAHGATSAATASRIAARDTNADLTARLFRSQYNGTEGVCSYFSGQVEVGVSGDNYIRPMTIAQALARLSLTNGAIISGFSINANYGYVRFSRRDGTGAFMIQWDNRFTSTLDTAQNYTFAFAFTSFCSVVLTTRNSMAGVQEELGPLSWWNTGFQIDRSDNINGNAQFGIIAIGN